MNQRHRVDKSLTTLVKSTWIIW